jgi:transcription termination factor NusB
MKRSYARENAFTMLYEKKFKPEISYAELYENALVCRELEDDPYIKGVILGVAEHEEEINSTIDRFLRRFTYRRAAFECNISERTAMYWEEDIYFTAECIAEEYQLF